jgi:hypothetical protein
MLDDKYCMRAVDVVIRDVSMPFGMSVCRSKYTLSSLVREMFAVESHADASPVRLAEHRRSGDDSFNVLVYIQTM